MEGKSACSGVALGWHRTTTIERNLKSIRGTINVTLSRLLDRVEFVREPERAVDKSEEGRTAGEGLAALTF